MKSQILDCACVIHGDLYTWTYVEKLYSMLRKHLPCEFRFNVFTESHRYVPAHMIRHDIDEWAGVQGRRSAWWYKLQLFDPARKLNRVFYLDLDTVVVNDLSWILSLDTTYFWTIRDFKYLWRPDWQGINSSMMLFDAQRFFYVWQIFKEQGMSDIRKNFRGDQDFLTANIPDNQRRFIDQNKAMSWRWQVYQGGLDMKTRQYRSNTTPTMMQNHTSLVVFHGNPKPHEVSDPLIQTHWY